MKTRSMIARERSMDALRRKRVRYEIAKMDLFSTLPDELLQKTLSRLSTAEAVRSSVLSSRWLDLWKWRPTLELDLRKDLKFKTPLHEATQMTKVINNHCGDLESCSIHHDISQCKDGTLEFVIHTVTRMKNAKELTLVNCPRRDGYEILRMDPETFSYSGLTSLSLSQFRLAGPREFEKCSNLKTLKLINITIARASDVSKVLAACSSLEVIVLKLRNKIALGGVLKIENNNLKFLQVTFKDRIERFRVHAASLDVFDIRFLRCERDYDFVLDAPNLGFNRNYWTNRGFPYPHISYDISALAQGKRSGWQELSEINEKKRFGSLSVSIDLTNQKEVRILKEILLMWSTKRMYELEIVFKNNNAAHGSHKKWYDVALPFPYANFRVHTVWMYNFNNIDAFLLASHFVTQKMVTKKMMIQTSTFPPEIKLNVEAGAARLMQLPKADKKFTVECF